MKAVNLEVPERAARLIMTPKKIKILVGGRWSGKSEVGGGTMVKYCADGDSIVSCREFLNSISDSTHSLLERKIRELQVEDYFKVLDKRIESVTGGKIVQRGLARNVGSIKSIDNIKRGWVEEAQYVSAKSLELLVPSFRAPGSEILFTMNRGSSKDAMSVEFLKMAERDLKRTGYYEDDLCIIAEMNWRDNPWYHTNPEARLLRETNKARWATAKYEHVWEGAYADTVDNAIIDPSWFDACIDAHLKLGFAIGGKRVLSYDPADSGDDKAICYLEGVVVREVEAKSDGDISEATTWACTKAKDINADIFVWDLGGMGTGLKFQVDQLLGGTKITLHGFNGAAAVERPNSKAEVTEENVKGSKTNEECYINLRAQKYSNLMWRCYRTWEAVTKNVYHDPETLISFSSECKDLPILRAELCSIPRIYNSREKFQIMSKPKMKQEGLGSPNTADVVMMSLSDVEVQKNINSASEWDQFNTQQGPRYAR